MQTLTTARSITIGIACLLLGIGLFIYQNRNQGEAEVGQTTNWGAETTSEAYDRGFLAGTMFGSQGVLSSEITNRCQYAVYEFYPAASAAADDALRGCKAGWDNR